MMNWIMQFLETKFKIVLNINMNYVLIKTNICH